MNMKKMMQQAQKMQRDLERAQAEIAEMTYEASSGGGAVKVVARGDHSIESISIDPDVVDPEDVEMLQDLILAAVNEGLRSISVESEKRLGAATGGLGNMKLPGLF